MKKILLARCIICILMLLPVLSSAQGRDASALPADQMKPLFTEPCLSGDGTEIAFVSGGDIWTVHLKGGAAHLLVSHRILKLGKVVGEPTAGWIIYTSGVQLIDGSVLRLPFIKVTDSMGNNMELVPCPVDIAVSRQIGESYVNKDSQLDVAVKELLNQIGERKQINKSSEGKKGE